MSQASHRRRRFPRIRAEALVLLLWTALVMTSCVRGGAESEAVRVSEDVSLQPLTPPLRTLDGVLQVRKLTCAHTIGKRTYAILTRPHAASRGSGPEVFAATRVHHSERWFAACSDYNSCRVHVVGGSVRPDRTYRLPPILSEETGRIFDGRALCTEAIDGLRAFPVARRPVLVPSAFIDLDLIAIASFTLWPAWLAGVVAIPTLRRRRAIGWSAALGITVTAALVALALSYVTLMFSTLLGPLNREIAAILTAILFTAVWRLSKPSR